MHNLEEMQREKQEQGIELPPIRPKGSGPSQLERDSKVAQILQAVAGGR